MGFWSSQLSDAAVDADTALCGFVSGCYWDDGEEEYTEVTSRETVTWAASDLGTATASNQPVLDVPGACTISDVLLHSSSGSTLSEGLCAYTLDPPVVFTEAGTFTLTAMTLSISG